MSAFFVGTDHIDAILSWVDHHYRYRFELPGGARVGDECGNDRVLARELTEIGKSLIAENIASLRNRYPGSWQEMVDVDTNEYRYRRDTGFASEPAAHVAVIKLCHCYEYQSCEHGGWPTSYAAKFIAMVEAEATRKLPGYASAPWTYDRPAIEVRRGGMEG